MQQYHYNLDNLSQSYIAVGDSCVWSYVSGSTVIESPSSRTDAMLAVNSLGTRRDRGSTATAVAE